MNVELLELLELDDLQGEVRELAECIGMEWKLSGGCWNVMAVPEKCISHSRIR